MSFGRILRGVFSLSVALSVSLAGCASAALAKPCASSQSSGCSSRLPDPASSVLIAAKTERYYEKEGFEKKSLDIVNTLKNNERTCFQSLLDGLVQAFDLDRTLRGPGPFTLLAPSDKAFERITTEDVGGLMANKKRLREVLAYHVIEGKFSARDLAEKGSVKTLEGHELRVSSRGGSIYADKALIRYSDLPCTNGVIHILDDVIIPPSFKDFSPAGRDQ